MFALELRGELRGLLYPFWLSGLLWWKQGFIFPVRGVNSLQWPVVEFASWIGGAFGRFLAQDFAVALVRDLLWIFAFPVSNALELGSLFLIAKSHALAVASGDGFHNRQHFDLPAD